MYPMESDVECPDCGNCWEDEFDYLEGGYGWTVLRCDNCGCEFTVEVN